MFNQAPQHLWTLMSSHKHSCVLMSTHEYGVMAPWAHISANECPWPRCAMLTTALGSWALRIFPYSMALSSWLFMAAYECPWAIMSTYEYPLALMRTQKQPIAAMSSSDYSWPLMNNHEYSLPWGNGAMSTRGSWRTVMIMGSWGHGHLSALMSTVPAIAPYL